MPVWVKISTLNYCWKTIVRTFKCTSAGVSCFQQDSYQCCSLHFERCKRDHNHPIQIYTLGPHSKPTNVVLGACPFLVLLSKEQARVTSQVGGASACILLPSFSFPASPSHCKGRVLVRDKEVKKRCILMLNLSEKQPRPLLCGLWLLHPHLPFSLLCFLAMVKLSSPLLSPSTSCFYHPSRYENAVKPRGRNGRGGGHSSEWLVTDAKHFSLEINPIIEA